MPLDDMRPWIGRTQTVEDFLAPWPAKALIATLDDVAQAADVSPITVSRALRGERSVDPALVVRVKAAAQKLGYVPDPAARALATRIIRHSPLAVGSILTAVTRGLNMSIGEGLQVESEQFAAMVPTSDLREGLAAWSERRPPNYSGR